MLTKQEFEALTVLEQRRYAEQQQHQWRHVHRMLREKCLFDGCNAEHFDGKCTTAIDAAFSATVPEEEE